MGVKNLSTRVAIIGRGAKCRGGSSAVDKSAYISLTTMYSEYDGTTYYPKYSEDLVHSEVMRSIRIVVECKYVEDMKMEEVFRHIAEEEIQNKANKFIVSA